MCNQGGTKEVCLAAPLQLASWLSWYSAARWAGAHAATTALGLLLLVRLLVGNIGFLFSRVKKSFHFCH
jgi:hypothetical protein